jgi:histidine triad (HIT) family protein
MYNHAPQGYDCPFCELSEGKETEYNAQADIVWEDTNTLAFVSPKWWINNPANVLVITKKHYENIYDIPDAELSDVYKVAKKIALAIKESYPSDGTSMRQHNEPGGGQDVWHFHVHVFPRYRDDKLYQNHENKKFITKEEKKEYVKKLRERLDKYKSIK